MTPVKFDLFFGSAKIFLQVERRNASMAEKSTGPPVRIIGSRELHQNLPTIMRELENNDASYVLTVHGKPKAVLIGAATYQDLVQGTQHPSEALVGLQLSALLGTTLDDQLIDDLKEHLSTNLDPGASYNI